MRITSDLIDSSVQTSIGVTKFTINLQPPISLLFGIRTRLRSSGNIFYHTCQWLTMYAVSRTKRTFFNIMLI